MPNSLFDLKSVAINGYIYAIGGSNVSSVDTAEVYYAKLNSNGSIGSWITNINSLPTANSAFGVAATNGYIYVGGGWNNTTAWVGAGTIALLYTSTARTLLGGSLDLVGVGGQTLTDGGSAGSLTAGNTLIVGTLGVQDQASFMQGVSVAGAFNASGDASIRSVTNSTTAFQVQNASGNSLIGVDTATTPNLIINSSFELSTDSWIPLATSTLTKITSQHYVGNAAMQVATTAASNEGTAYPYSLASSTQYSLSFYAKAGSSFTTMQACRADDE